MAKYILPFSSSEATLARAGGKGANLVELARAGFAVPHGFIITTDAYRTFVLANRLELRILALAQSISPDHPTALENTAAEIRALFEHGTTPDAVADEITLAYRELSIQARNHPAPKPPNLPVAVRSSATAEDLPGLAFAGQQDTYLNIVGEDAVLDAVIQCWASLWTARAMAYRARNHIPPEQVALAVVVQELIASESSGVLFTANPVTGRRDEMVIDASFGLGEAIVSGQVDPDHYVINSHAWTITERKLGAKEIAIIPRAAKRGGTERVTSHGAEEQALGDAQIIELAQTAQRVAEHWGTPQDIEWAWVKGKSQQGQIFILQSRPITALPEPPPHPSRPVQMLSGIFAEMFPIRPYPLDQTTWVPAVSAAAVEPIFGLIGIAAPPLSQMFIEEDGVVVRFSGKLTFRPTPGILLAPLRLLWTARRYDPVHWRADPLPAEARSRARALEARNLQDLSWEGLLAIVQEALTLALPLAGEPRRRYLPRALLAAGLLRIALGLLGHGDRFGTLLSDNVESKTLEANRALEALAARVRSDATLASIFANNEAGELRAALEKQPAGRAFLAELKVFLERYGHREVVLSSALQPTWKDAPEVVLGIVKGFALSESLANTCPGGNASARVVTWGGNLLEFELKNAHDDLRQRTTEPPAPQSVAASATWEVARDEVLAHPMLRLPPLRSAFLDLLAAARCLWQIREDTHFDATMILPILRRTLLEFGRRLVSVGVLNVPADVFHLRRGELERIAVTWPPPSELADEMRALVLRRKERRAALEGTPLIDPRLYRQREPSGEALLRGTAGSPGIAEGPVRVVHNASEFGRLRAGEVLVAPYTNPAWTPLFQRAIAVVVDGGAAGSHAAIVAREYGIPAVMGTVTGTQTLRDGQRVRVDGDRGLVLKAEEPK